MKLTSSMETSTRNLSRQTAYNDLAEESPTQSDCDDFSDTDSFIMYEIFRFLFRLQTYLFQTDFTLFFKINNITRRIIIILIPI